MQLTLGRWRARPDAPYARRFPYRGIEVALVIVLAIQCVRLGMIAFAPLEPIAPSQISRPAPADNASVLKTFDPFFRFSGQSGVAVVTSLPLKLFGVRVDQATGMGSAIIATPDGVQQSFAVSDEIMPGVRLKSVARDNVTLDRNGSLEQLYLDQSVPAPVALSAMQAEAKAVAGSHGPPPASETISLAALKSGTGFVPRLDQGHVTGFAVGPRGTGDVFRAAGFMAGDVLTQINGVILESGPSAAKAVANISPGTQASFTVERAGRTVTLFAQVGQ